MSKFKQTSISDIILDIVIYTSLFILTFSIIIPILHIFSVSLSDSEAVLGLKVGIWPVGFTIESYSKIFTTKLIPNAFKNSVIYTLVGTVINLSLTALTAYPLSKKELTLSKLYMTLIIITMYIGGGLIPMLLLIRGLGLFDTMWSLILPGAIATGNLLMLRSFFQTIPAELEESAKIDGANDFLIFISIVIPTSKAALATIGLFYAVGHWNSFMGAIIYLQSFEKMPLQVILREIVIKGTRLDALAYQDPLESMKSEAWSTRMKYATLFVSMIPMMMVYPFVQKYFVKGVMIGSLKG